MSAPDPIEVQVSDWPAYRLLDSGGGRKLELFGQTRLIRGEPKAWWQPALPAEQWGLAVAEHSDEQGCWKFREHTARAWPMRWRGLTLEAKFTETSKHLGLFPEQSYHWAGIQERGPGPDTPETGRARLLNLFGYTGAASLAAAAAGFAVTHVDASKTAVTWARNNQERSGLAAAPIRWIIDDALKYVRREARRGSRYEALLLDPPSFGRGPKKEMWKAETHLHELILACREVLAPEPRFVLLTLYALEASSLMAGNLVAEMMAGHPGRVRTGELALREESAGRLLPLALWARWEMEH